MTGKLSASLALVKASAGVLKADKELMFFPAVSGVASMLVAATFFVPAWTMGLFEQMTSNDVVAYLFLLAFYLVEYTVVFFFNTALVGAALIRLGGGDPTVADGLNIALAKFTKILGYAAIAATVGMVLRAVSERMGVVGRLVIGLVGMTWNLATFLVVPVLVTRDVGPADAIKESAALFKRTWGEQVVGNAGLGLAFFLMFTSLALFGTLFTALAAQLAPAAVVGVLVAFGAGFVALALAASAMSGIYSAALYRYAMTGEATGAFDSELLGGAFRTRGR